MTPERGHGLQPRSRPPDRNRPAYIPAIPIPSDVHVHCRSFAASGALWLALAGMPAGLAAQSPAAPPSLTPDQAEARAIFAELVNVNTTHDHGSTGPAAQAVARRFRDAGFPDSDIAVVGPNAGHLNVVARLRGTGAKRPVLLLAHLDVVEALRQDWSLDPFSFTERDGFFYGRGTSDIKDMAAIYAATLLRLRREGFVPDRDLILALTAGEEGGDDNGVQWLIANRRDLIDAAYCINGDGGDPLARDGAVYFRNVQASEKVYIDLQFQVKNPGGHSSLPLRNNAIYHLAGALDRLAGFSFPARLNEVTRAYLARAAATQPPATGRDMRLAARGDAGAIRRLSASSPFFNAQFRTTCVATRLEAGHANNALPQTATAIVNCRMLPDEKLAGVLAALRRVVADTAVAISVVQDPVPSPPSPLVPEVLQPVERITAAMWPDAVVVPSMETGATDGLYLRNAGMPVYGVSGVPLDEDDIRAHGRDERIRVAAFYQGLEFSYRLVKALATGN
jgi:acetylornithine deacetylase/succinyl-diaminopimelate desuccinylase-like protein